MLFFYTVYVSQKDIVVYVSRGQEQNDTITPGSWNVRAAQQTEDCR